MIDPKSLDPVTTQWSVEESVDNELHWKIVARRIHRDDAEALAESYRKKFPTRRYRVCDISPVPTT